MSEEHSPWTVLSSEVRYESPWITLTHHDVVTPAGTPGIYGWVHFKNLALGVIVLDDEMNTWLVGQYRFPLQRYSWEIPEGGGALNVDPLESIQRELKEETGIEAATWRELLHLDLSNSVTDEVATVYLATGLSFGEAAPEETEALRLWKLPFAEVYQMVDDGRITDAMTVAAVLKVRLLQIEGRL